MFNVLSDASWITAVSTLVGSVITYLVTKANNKKELAINDRMQLSKDQYEFIGELREMMVEQREEIDNLKAEIKELQAVNIALTIENRQLQQKITELTNKLEKFERQNGAS